MPYANFHKDTFIGRPLAAIWTHKPPALLDLTADYTLLKSVMTGTAPLGVSASTLNILDQIMVRRVAVFCNFADGLLFTPTTLLAISIGYTLDGVNYLGGTQLFVEITALNTWVEVNQFLPHKDLVTVAPRLLCSIEEIGYTPSFATGPINPDLAEDATSLPLGSTGIKFDIMLEADHSFDLKNPS